MVSGARRVLPGVSQSILLVLPYWCSSLFSFTARMPQRCHYIAVGSSWANITSLVDASRRGRRLSWTKTLIAILSEDCHCSHGQT